MSGHSKWATTKHKKAAIDAKRSTLFSKLARQITVAAKVGGDPNPDNNAQLAAAVERAKAQSMPKDKIKAAIDKGSGASKDGSNYEEVVYEGYGPAGVAVYCEALTDNRNRTAADVRSAFSHSGGKQISLSNCLNSLTAPGSPFGAPPPLSVHVLAFLSFATKCPSPQTRWGNIFSMTSTEPPTPGIVKFSGANSG